MPLRKIRVQHGDGARRLESFLCMIRRSWFEVIGTHPIVRVDESRDSELIAQGGTLVTALRGTRECAAREGCMRILVVDDHVLIRDALRGVLNELRPDATVVDAPSGDLARRATASSTDLELVLLDLGLPDADGFALLSELRRNHPGIAVVVLSAREDRESMTRALDLGAVGFIPKSASRPVMLAALQLVFSGGIYVPPEILVREMGSMHEQPPTPDDRPASAHELGLTERQLEVLALIVRGKSNKAICRALDLAEPTVKNHVTAVLRALRVSSRAEAIAAFNQMSLTLPRS